MIVNIVCMFVGIDESCLTPQKHLLFLKGGASEVYELQNCFISKYLWFSFLLFSCVGISGIGIHLAGRNQVWLMWVGSLTGISTYTHLLGSLCSKSPYLWVGRLEIWRCDLRVPGHPNLLS